MRFNGLFNIGRNLLLNYENRSDNDTPVAAQKRIWIMNWQLACSVPTSPADSGDLESFWHSWIVTFKVWSTALHYTHTSHHPEQTSPWTFFLQALLTQTSLAHPRSLLQVWQTFLRCCVGVGCLKTIFDNPLDCCVWVWVQHSITSLCRGANKLFQAAMLQEEPIPRMKTTQFLDLSELQTAYRTRKGDHELVSQPSSGRPSGTFSSNLRSKQLGLAVTKLDLTWTVDWVFFFFQCTTPHRWTQATRLAPIIPTTMKLQATTWELTVLVRPRSLKLVSI